MTKPPSSTAPSPPPREPLAPGAGVAALARHALQCGQDALAAGDTVAAVRWLDRAHRLVPQDGTVTLLLATACLPQDAGRAAVLFRGIAESDDLRAAWLGLSMACLRTGDARAAAAALAAALARHAPDPAMLESRETLADAVAEAAGAAGWCGLTGDGELIVRPARAGRPTVRIDGQPCPGASLPRNWTQAREISVCLDSRHLLGSPVQVLAIRRVAGFVEAWDGGLRGWAWHPGDPDSDPVLQVSGGAALPVTARDRSVQVPHTHAMAQPRGFTVPPAALAGRSGLLHVTGRDGSELLGSPLDPALAQATAAAAAAALARYLSPTPGRIAPFPPPAIPVALATNDSAPAGQGGSGDSWRSRSAALQSTGVAASAPLGRQGRRVAAATPVGAAALPVPDSGVAVVVPVHGAAAKVHACLDSVFATVRPPHRIIVVDDASPDPALAQALDGLAAAGRIQLVRHARNLGFPASANDGMAASAGLDVVLLNSDTLVPAGWLERLREAAYAAPDIGTATPLSNEASILSYPGPAGSNGVPDLAATLRLDAAARRANKREVVDIPVGIGFCLYLRRDCLDATGPFRTDVFAQGYGEENDFCLRARHLGWRHVAATGVFVAHLGGGSFGGAGRHLQIRNEALLNRLHPGYDRLIAAFGAADPLAGARRRLDLVRWRALGTKAKGSAILVTHDEGGGVERQVGVSAARHLAAGLRPIVLRPELREDADAWVVVDGAKAGFPNLRYALPEEMPALLKLLRDTAPVLAEVHHTLHHPPAILSLVERLGVPYDVHVHDYPWFCPQVALVGADRRYCGEPGVAECEACVADYGSVIGETIGVQALRDRSAGFLGAARRVSAPSEDAARRMAAHFPGLHVAAVPPEDDAAIADPPPPRAQDGTCRVCVLGAIGVHKGYDILLACARDAAARRLPLAFVVVGHSIDDARLMMTGRVFVTGGFERGEAVPLLRAQRASLALLPSVCPETWSFGLTELWQAGLRVAAFDFGAPAERIRRTGRGLLLPLGIPPRGINNALVAAAGLTGHEDA